MLALEVDALYLGLAFARAALEGSSNLSRLFAIICYARSITDEEGESLRTSLLGKESGCS